MDSSTIRSIKMHKNGLIEMYVTCDECKSENVHVITHATTATVETTTIDFAKLGTRVCHNYHDAMSPAGSGGGGSPTNCYADYRLYTPSLL